MTRSGLIVIEGIDGSGKSTQYKMLCGRLDAEGTAYRRVVFPRYAEPSSAMLKMYLGGQFGKNPGDVSARAASVFFCVDRYASYRLDWGEAYRAGALILSDRYVTSNAVHQGAKLEPDERREYFDWLDDFEYRVMELPRPDFVIYLDVDVETALLQISERQRKTGKPADIHEADRNYLARCASTGAAAAERFGWRRVACVRGEKMRPPEDIHGEIFSLLRGVI
jgi:dTMP kinase